jgi:hypothetical protein
VVLFALLALAAACAGGDGDGESRGPVLTPIEARFLPITVSSDVAVGPNRFLVGLIDQEENAEVLGAQLHFRFFKLDGDDATLKFETDAETIRVEKSFTVTRQDGTVETVDAGESGVYVANVEFDAPGNWKVEVSGTVDGEPMEPVTPLFQVRERNMVVTVGDPAPLSVQPILSDVDDISEIDTSDPPDPEMHGMTIADAVTSGRPTLITFSTPAFCVSRICGPTKQAVDRLYARYKGQANFVHVEPYDLDKARSGEGLEVLPFLEQEWGLRTEPWVFLVDKDGTIAARFEAIVTEDEIEEALQRVL